MIGSGYVGLVSGACFADFGHDVICVDKDETKVQALRRGETTIYEPGLAELVEKNISEQRLTFASNSTDAVRRADVVFIAVGTPPRSDDGHADLSYVYAVAREIALGLDHFTVIAIKSTVPVGTGDEIEEIIRKIRPDAEFEIVSNPEFLREGAAIQDFKHPDRIVIGVNDERSKAIMSSVYRPLYLNVPPILFTKRRTSELIKYASNAFLATKITFINEIADLCEHVGTDVQEVARGIGLDNRIGSKFLNAGPGFGGSCFNKDTTALIKTAQDVGAPLRIVEATVAANKARKHAIAKKVAAQFDGDIKGKLIAILGLSFKPNTDDMRDAPSITVINTLQEMGARIRAFDPAGIPQAKKVLHDVEYAEGPYECVKGADALVIITEWEQFRALDLGRIKTLMASPIVIDLRNIYRLDEMKRLGFVYVSVGRPNFVKPPQIPSKAGG
jgi:UDPglucose 6-dehydrogenase